MQKRVNELVLAGSRIGEVYMESAASHIRTACALSREQECSPFVRERKDEQHILYMCRTYK